MLLKDFLRVCELCIKVYVFEDDKEIINDYADEVLEVLNDSFLNSKVTSIKACYYEAITVNIDTYSEE